MCHQQRAGFIRRFCVNSRLGGLGDRFSTRRDATSAKNHDLAIAAVALLVSHHLDSMQPRFLASMLINPLTRGGDRLVCSVYYNARVNRPRMGCLSLNWAQVSTLFSLIAGGGKLIGLFCFQCYGNNRLSVHTRMTMHPGGIRNISRRRGVAQLPGRQFVATSIIEFDDYLFVYDITNIINVSNKRTARLKTAYYSTATLLFRDMDTC